MKKVDTSISSVASVYNTDSKVAVQSVMNLSDLALMVSCNTIDIAGGPWFTVLLIDGAQNGAVFWL